MPLLANLRSAVEIFTKPTAACLGNLSARFDDHYDGATHLPETNELGSREDLLHAMGICARLCYGTGSVEDETWGKIDPPLNGEGWRVVEQVCETMHSESKIQAALYLRDGAPHLKMGIIAFRGTASRKGLIESISLAVPVARLYVKHAVMEACSFYQMCQAKYPGLHLYVTGQSLGGYIAESCASFEDADGAAFNSPGPWRPLSVTVQATGHWRPDFEVHLTRDDPLAFAVFPKPENSKHICHPIWHEGSSHRVCKPYMKEITEMWGIHPNGLPVDDGETVHQLRMLFSVGPAFSELDRCFHDCPDDLDEEASEDWRHGPC
mmetsp:Transcript_81960/g.155661  ORF Transcript_81960/g.155661 Transcript_81960/m.155661 type:complete len:322 (-) Transcript_81960:286-1251(-)